MRRFFLFLCTLALLAGGALACPASAAEEEPFTQGSFCAWLVDNLDLQADVSGVENPFRDISPEEPYYEEILICYELGVVTGTSSSTFSPNSHITRASAASILYRAVPLAGVPEDLPEDVDMNSWYYDGVCAMLANGVMLPLADGMFEPHDNAYPSHIHLQNLRLPEIHDTVQLDLSLGDIEIGSLGILDGFRVSQSGTVFYFRDACLIRQSSLAPTEHMISVSGVRGAAIILTDLNIQPRDHFCLRLMNSEVSLQLLGANTFSGGIYAINFTNSDITLTGDGSLTATGSIGGTGSLTIRDTTVSVLDEFNSAISADELSLIRSSITAESGHTSAILGGDGGIQIEGGIIRASSSSYAGAAIRDFSGPITIRDAQLYLEGCAGIGGGGNEEGCPSITLINTVIHGTDACVEKIFDADTLADQTALPGHEVALVTEAYGASGLSWQWQVSPDGESGWTDLSGETGARLTLTLSGETDGKSYRCRLTNGFGNVVYTNAAQVHALAFTLQPRDTEAKAGQLVALRAEASCRNVTYQWEMSLDGGTSWQPVEGETYSTLAVTAGAENAGALYRCVVTASNGDPLASEPARLTVPSLGGNCAVYYYQQDTTGEGYTCVERLLLPATAGEQVTAPDREFPGFHENEALGTPQGTVSPEGELTLARYYDRELYAITFDSTGGSRVEAVTALFGAPVQPPVDPVRPGFDFAGWYVDLELEDPFNFEAMPLGGCVLYAGWTSKDLGRHDGEYALSGLRALDMVTLEPLDLFPAGTFYAEVTVTSLEAEGRRDLLLLAAYDREGRLVDLNYFYASFEPGQSVTFGCAIDNSGGNMAVLKAMMLSSLAGAQPLAPSLTLSQTFP